MKVELTVRKGADATRYPGVPDDFERVTHVEIPHFRVPPELVVWGRRFFTLDTTTRGWVEPRYVECFAYFVPMTTTVEVPT